MKLQHSITAACVAATSFGLGAGALAATTVSNTLTVQLELVPTCSVQPASLVFANPGSLSNAVTAEQNIQLRCTTGTSYTIGFGPGAHALGTQRRLKHATAAFYINYELFKTSNYTQPLGTSGNGIISGVGNGNNQIIPVHGRVTAQNAPSIGTYSDSVQVSVTY